MEAKLKWEGRIGINYREMTINEEAFNVKIKQNKRYFDLLKSIISGEFRGDVDTDKC